MCGYTWGTMLFVVLPARHSVLLAGLLQPVPHACEAGAQPEPEYRMSALVQNGCDEHAAAVTHHRDIVKITALAQKFFSPHGSHFHTQGEK
jgi:hypothetical protein